MNALSVTLPIVALLVGSAGWLAGWAIGRALSRMLGAVLAIAIANFAKQFL